MARADVKKADAILFEAEKQHCSVFVEDPSFDNQLFWNFYRKIVPYVHCCCKKNF